MSAAATDEVAQHLAHFVREPLELRKRKVSQVQRRQDRRQNGISGQLAPPLLSLFAPALMIWILEA
jgi:hypothetical protein